MRALADRQRSTAHDYLAGGHVRGSSPAATIVLAALALRGSVGPTGELIWHRRRGYYRPRAWPVTSLAVISETSGLGHRTVLAALDELLKRGEIETSARGLTARPQAVSHRWDHGQRWILRRELVDHVGTWTRERGRRSSRWLLLVLGILAHAPDRRWSTAQLAGRLRVSSRSLRRILPAARAILAAESAPRSAGLRVVGQRTG